LCVNETCQWILIPDYFQISAGKSTGNAKEASDKLKGLGVEVFVIGIGDGVAKTELNKIASQPVASHVFTVNYGALEILSSLLAEKICESKLPEV
jgi:hypothetical protein